MSINRDTGCSTCLATDSCACLVLAASVLDNTQAEPTLSEATTEFEILEAMPVALIKSLGSTHEERSTTQRLDGSWTCRQLNPTPRRDGNTVDGS